jgi:hypothetical protein
MGGGLGATSLAFKEKDWGSFITSIESKKSELSELEKKRLQYARKQL